MAARRKESPESFFARNSVFTLGEWARSQGKGGNLPAARDQLKHYLRRRRVRSLERGLYAVVPYGSDTDTFEPDRFLVAAALRADGVFCYHAALELLGAAHSDWNECTVFSTRRRAPLYLDSACIRFLSPPRPLLRRRRLDAGVVPIPWNGRTLQVTGRERTLVEGFRQPRYMGGLEELVASAAGFGVLDLDLLAFLLEAYGEKSLWALVGWFLATHRDRFHPPGSLLATCERRRPVRPLYVPRSQRGGHLLKRWNLVLPESLARGFEGIEP